MPMNTKAVGLGPLYCIKAIVRGLWRHDPVDLILRRSNVGTRFRGPLPRHNASVPAAQKRESDAITQEDAGLGAGLWRSGASDKREQILFPDGTACPMTAAAPTFPPRD